MKYDLPKLVYLFTFRQAALKDEWVPPQMQHQGERHVECQGGGYWLDRGEVGKGVVTRACRTLIKYAFEELGMNRIEIQCSAENRRSAAVPERLGFTKEGVLRQAELRNGKLHDFSIYGLLAEDQRLW